MTSLPALVPFAALPALVPFAALASTGRLLGSVSGLVCGAQHRLPAHTAFARSHGTATGHAGIVGGAGLSHVKDAAQAFGANQQSSSSPSFATSGVAPHPGMKAPSPPTDDEVEACWRPVYDTAYLEKVKPFHITPERLYQRIGFRAIMAARWTFDKLTGYGPNMTEAKWLQRMIFLETIAGVPGMVAGVLRHLKSLRSMKRDHGWIHTLLQEAENERMHLLTFFELRKPGPLFRASIIVAQGVFWNLYFIGYLLSPRTCHAAVGFLEEEAVKTYTHALQEIDAGRLWKGKVAPPIACEYWGLKPGASMRDLILAVRADEACHAHVNHTLSGLPATAPNPFAYGASQLP